MWNIRYIYNEAYSFSIVVWILSGTNVLEKIVFFASSNKKATVIIVIYITRLKLKLYSENNVYGIEHT